ncbi:MAG: cyclodeaminase/cyclohydrolase family protein [Prevotellaceae bacterium]|jgi:formiminotetrahydrofolate cyclodeaminase|nr:cyclodeaminase/cyclohydrolase family protein [Prevotellaceae bacterium]
MLATTTLTDFLNRTASNEPVPGGGSIAALNGAVASALATMVARLTIGKKKYEAHEALMQHIEALMLGARESFMAYIDRDADAYNALFACYKMPKEREEERENRSLAIEEATKQAAIVPMEVARQAAGLMEPLFDVVKLGNRNAVTDACVAVMSARTAVLGALLNVRINLTGIKDEAFVNTMREEADRLEADVVRCEQEVLEAVRQELSV